MKRSFGLSTFQPFGSLPFALVICLAATTPVKAASYYEDAMQRMDAKDFAGAVIQLKNALRKEPNTLAVQFQLGRALQQTGDVVGAEVAFLEALRLGVSRTEVVVPLAQVLVAQGRQQEMLAHPQLQPVGLPPAVTQTLLLQRASAQVDLGDARTGLTTIAQARAINDTRADVWLAEVPVRIRSGQLSESLQAADRALAIEPNNADAYYAKGSVLHVQGALDLALTAYGKALSLSPSHTESLIAQAGIFMDRAQVPQAKQSLEKLKAVAPKEPRGAYLRALVAEREGQSALVKASLIEVTRLLDPVPIGYVRYRPQLLTLNGLAHYGLNQLSKSRQYLEALLKVQPGSPALRLLARIHIREGNPSAAVPLLEGHLRAHPDDAMALTLLGSAYLAQGKAARATPYLQEALKKQDLPEYRAAFGFGLLQGGRFADALPELEAAWRRDTTQVVAAVSLVQLYSSQKKFPQALAVVRELIKQQPKRAELHALLGEVLAKSGQTAAARQAYEAATTLDARQVAPRLQLARMDVQSNRIDLAEQRLRAILRDSPKSSDAMAEMARVSERLGKQEDALRWLLRARDASDRKDVRWNLALMELNLRQGNTAQAVAEGKLALEKQPDDVRVLLLHSRIQLRHGDMSGARQTLGTATRVAEFDAPLQTEIAQLQLAAGNVQGAAYSLDKAMSGQASFLPAHALMVQVELKQGNLDNAEQRARKIVQGQPQRAIGHTMLGIVALARGNSDAAQLAHRQAHKLEPTSQTALILMELLARQGHSADALDVGRQWLKRAPSDVAILMAVGDLHAVAGRFGDAVQMYRAALKSNPEHVGALNSLANAYFKLKDLAAAKATAEAAYRLAPSDPLVADTLGWLLFQHGRVDAALPLLRDARLRAPDNPEIRYHLGKVLMTTGRKAEAKAELREALRLSPLFDGGADAQILLKSLP